MIVIPRFNAAGTIDHFVTISTDITPIREQADTLQVMIDNFPGGIALIDRDFRLAASNKLYRTLLDMPESLFSDPHPPAREAGSLPGRARRLWSRRRRAIVANRLKTLLSPVPNIDERQELNGKMLEIRCVPVPGGGHVNTYVDVTDRRQAEHEAQTALTLRSKRSSSTRRRPSPCSTREMRYVAHSDRWLQDYNLPDESLVGRITTMCSRKSRITGGQSTKEF